MVIPVAPAPKATEPPKQRYVRRKAMLWSERSTWEPDWRQLVDYVAPYAGRFTASEANRGNKVSRANKIHDNTAKKSLNVCGAGLQAGMTSPARPWFRLSTGDLQLDDQHDIKTWLRSVEDKMRQVFAASNVYRGLHQMYLELIAFGTGCVIMLKNFDNVVHLMPLTIGEYALATDENGKVNTMVRELRMTVGQMCSEFGEAACSTTVRNLYAANNLDAWIEVVHLIEPRKDRDATKLNGKNKRYRSVYFEKGSDNDKVLREGGFDNFDVLAPRWMVLGSDVYGTGPGHDALPDVRQLQHGQLRKGQAIDYKTNPPLQAPAALKEAGLNRLPGGIVYTDAVSRENAVQTLFDVDLDLSDLREDILDVRERIKGHFYEDLFLMMANDTRSGTTATEIAERHEEKLLMLGPVLERLQNELFDPLIDFTFDCLADAGALLPPPQALRKGHVLNVQYIGLLAQAQRAVALKSIDRFIATAASIAGATQSQEVWDKVDTDEIMDEYGDGLGINPKLLRSDDAVQAMRGQRKQQQQAQAALAAAESASKTAANVGSTSPQNVQDVMGMFQGYGSPQATELPA